MRARNNSNDLAVTIAAPDQPVLYWSGAAVSARVSRRDKKARLEGSFPEASDRAAMKTEDFGSTTDRLPALQDGNDAG